ncbi:hypothetical protein [Aestuariimicrobium sp. Y1814]|uniref:hypothetical protein n=1 Tax=Aestuariimicrobium sp. Y1814 TaxID=3418742 RepID=UPI003DA6D18B
MASHALPRSMSRERRTSLVLMIVVTLVGLACAFGPIWMVRAGLLASILGAAASVWFAFREISRLEVLHRSELKTARDAAARAANAHHVESMNLIETFTTRSKAHAEQLAGLRAELSARKTELSSLRGNLVSARAESDRRGSRITELQAELAQRTAELATLEQQLADLAPAEAEVVTLPRRTAAHTVMNGSVPTAAELWSDGNHPTVVDLTQLKLNFPDHQLKEA